jgi:hypothetical protein
MAFQNYVDASDKWKCPSEQPARITKEITATQFREYVPTCSVVGNNSYVVLRQWK